ncbi:MAG: dihydrofolate reductase [Muribaculaceae bacterium]|nr:dihydrofolate reductase [Muribaculaceae bacterium]
MKTNEICAIVAMGDNFEIGYNGDLIWRIKEDLKRFKQLTTGHPIIMGRKTRDSLPKALPGRTNIVITRNPGYSAADTLVAHSLEEALDMARRADGSDKIFIIGGGQIYEEAFPLLDSIEVTHIYDIQQNADTFFPAISSEDWKLSNTTDLFRTPDGLSYGFESYHRIKYKPFHHA